jgi:hypothetical protein
MVDTKQRRRGSKIVHDHKGTAIVEWVDRPESYERPVLEVEEAGPLAIQTESPHNPYMRIPETIRQRAPGERRDLRKLSAWIKMMRALEEAKQRKDD